MSNDLASNMTRKWSLLLHLLQLNILILGSIIRLYSLRLELHRHSARETILGHVGSLGRDLSGEIEGDGRDCSGRMSRADGRGGASEGSGEEDDADHRSDRCLNVSVG